MWLILGTFDCKSLLGEMEWPSLYPYPLRFLGVPNLWTSACAFEGNMRKSEDLSQTLL